MSDDLSETFSEISIDNQNVTNSLQYEFIQGERRGSKLLYTTEEKQLYRKKDSYKGKENFECIEKECSRRIFLDQSGNCFKCKNFEKHLHGSQEAKYSKLKFMNVIKEECAKPANIVMHSKRVFYNHSAK